MRLHPRMDEIVTYRLAALSRAVARLRAEGADVINLTSGDPDLPPPPHVIEALRAAALDPANHGYPGSDGLPELRAAFADWFAGRFGVALDPATEVLPLIGSKEGIVHLSFGFVGPGDCPLVPDPAYPFYDIRALLAGAKPHYVPLREANDYLPDLEAIPAAVADRARILWLNYPNNPLGATAGLDFFERAVHFARRHDLLVCHD